MSDFDFDTREFNAGVDAVLTACRDKTHPEVLNRAALHTIIGGKGVQGAIQRTPRANVESITPEKVAPHVAKVLRYNGQKVTRAEFKRLVKKEVTRRKRSKGYTAGPGWSKAAQAFGGRGVRTQKGFPQSEAAKGYGDQATPGNLVAEIANTAPAAEIIGTKPLQDALNDVGRDMQEYAARKHQQLFNKHSAK